MNKKWLLGSAVLLLLVGSLLYWWPVLADTTPSTCPLSSKCIFNDNDNGALLIQTQNGDIDLKIATTTGSAGIYFNRRSTTTYGLVVKANGTLLHNGYPVVIADGGTYNINSSGSNSSEFLNFQYGEFLPRHVINQQIFTVYEDPIYFGFTEKPVIGLSSIYSYDSIQQPPLAGQLAFVRKGTGTTSTQQLQFRFNDSEFPLNWGPWREICDYSNNCHNFINVLDDSNTGDVVIYQDPDFLISSGLKITSTSSLVNCTVLSTVSGEIICGTSTPGGGDNLGNHIATQNIRLNDHWLSGDGGDEGVFVNSIGNVGIGTREPTTKLYVDGPTIVNGTLQVPNISAGIVKSGSGGTFTSVSAISSTDISSLTWSKLTNFPTACGTGQYVSGLSSSTLTCSTPTNTTYSAGNGLSLTGTTFSLAASGANNYITKWTGTNTLGTSTIYETNNNIGIGTTSLNEKLTVQGNIKVSSLAGTGSRCLYATAGGVISATTSDCGTSAGGDNLGNHIATKNIQLNGYWLSKDGDDEGVFVDKDGKVGIGTTSPATKLHIYDATSGPIITLSGLDTNYRGLTIKNTSNNEKWFVGNNTSNNFVIRATNTNDILTISSSNGNVGIGTTSSPSTKLDVNGSLAVRGSVSFTSSSYTGSNRLLMVDSFGNVSATSTAGVSLPSGNTGQTLRYGTSGWEATNNIYIDVNTGNVGIGSTTSPAGKLQVFGSTFG